MSLFAGMGAVIGSGSAAAAEGLAELFARYNPQVWPGHVVAYALALGAVGLLVWRPGPTASRFAVAVLAALWLWLGVVFHAMYATDLDPVLGTVYALMFILQAGLLLRAGVIRDELTITTGQGHGRVAGWLLVGFALAVYPLLGAALGHAYPLAPLFGMAPCPTTIATFGFLLLALPRLPGHLLVVPSAWAVLGPLGAVPQGMAEDLALFAAGILAVAIVVRVRRVDRSHVDGHRRLART